MSDTDTYVDSSDESEYESGDEVVVGEIPIYCACCEEFIHRRDFYLYLEETEEYICEDCCETANIEEEFDAEQTEQ